MDHPVSVGLAVCILHLPGITCHRLSNTKVGDPGIQSLTNRLNRLSGLRTLDLFGHMLNDDVASVLAPAVLCMFFLEHLNLTGSRFGDSGISFISHAIQALSNLQTLLLGIF